MDNTQMNNSEMENSLEEVEFYRNESESENNLLIINSPIDISDDNILVYQNADESTGSNGYYVVYKRDHFLINNPPNYQDKTKRRALNEILRKMYFFNGLTQKLKWAPGFALSTRQELWHQVNSCLRPEIMSASVARLYHVKRQLFRRDHSRKQTQPKRSQSWGETIYCIYCRPIRRYIERPFISRNYLKLAKQLVLQDVLRECLVPEMQNTPEVCQIIINAAEGIYSVDRKVVLSLINGARRMEAMILRSQMETVKENQQEIVDESVRSVFYAKQLFRLIQHEEEQLSREE